MLACRTTFLAQLLELPRHVCMPNSWPMEGTTRFIAIPSVIQDKHVNGCVCCNHKLVPIVLEDDAGHGFSSAHRWSTISVNVARSSTIRRGISSSFTNRFTRLQTMLAAIKGVWQIVRAVQGSCRV